MKRTFAEIGFGNETFLSTEVEEGESEYRIPHFVMPEQFYDLYLRVWLGKRSVVFSTKDGIKVKQKDRKAFKFLLGVGGGSL